MENQSKSCNHTNCWTKCIAIIALSVSLFCLGILFGQCMSNCSSKKSKCKTKCEKSYKKCKSDSYSGSTCTYGKKEKEAKDDSEEIPEKTDSDK